MSASNTITGNVTASFARQDGQWLIRVNTGRSEIIAVHPEALPEGKRVTVTGSPPRLVGG